jgi:hypothetical protein
MGNATIKAIQSTAAIEIGYENLRSEFLLDSDKISRDIRKGKTGVGLGTL